MLQGKDFARMLGFVACSDRSDEWIVRELDGGIHWLRRRVDAVVRGVVRVPKRFVFVADTAAITMYRAEWWLRPDEMLRRDVREDEP